MINLRLLILKSLETRPTLAAPQLSTSSPASLTMTSLTLASLPPLAFPPRALSAMRPQASTARRTAKPIAFLAGASLAACPAPSPHRRPSPLALVSPLRSQTLVNRKQVSWQPFEREIISFQYCLVPSVPTVVFCWEPD